jgi:hypothetical protein
VTAAASARSARILFVLAALAAAGCSSQWYPGYAHQDICRTDIVIRTVPEGATIRFDDKQQPSPAPIRIPIEYDHTETMWERQTNAGEDMRESMHPVFQVLTFPVWGIASFFHHKESLRRHEYGGNKHAVSALLPGFDEGYEEITLAGEAEFPLTMKLVRSK